VAQVRVLLLDWLHTGPNSLDNPLLLTLPSRLPTGATAQQKNIEELKELKRSQEQELQALREKVKAKEAGKAAAVAAAGN
jgi:hypothetical protein